MIDTRGRKLRQKQINNEGSGSSTHPTQQRKRTHDAELKGSISRKYFSHMSCKKHVSIAAQVRCQTAGVSCSSGLQRKSLGTLRVHVWAASAPAPVSHLCLAGEKLSSGLLGWDLCSQVQGKDALLCLNTDTALSVSPGCQFPSSGSAGGAGTVTTDKAQEYTNLTC